MNKCRCCESQRDKAGGWQILAHLVERGKGYLRRGKWRGGERCVSVRYIVPNISGSLVIVIIYRVMSQACPQRGLSLESLN